MRLSKKNKEKIIQSTFLKWYKKNKRKLPWRKIQSNNLPNPYYVLVSEFMLQQTTVNTVVKKFNEFVVTWPSIENLNNTSEKMILKFWSGLGYYNRAINLLKTIKIISKVYKNKIPKSYDELIKLPGIGDYTAKAILGIAFNDLVFPIDANIERILARIYGIKYRVNSHKKIFENIASKYISNKKSGDLIQSFMDYGSVICVPRNPKCEKCLVKKYCIAREKKIQDFIPVKNNSPLKKIKFTRAYVIVNQKNEILINKRPSSGMLPSMLQVPNDNWSEKKILLKRDYIYKKISKKLKKIGELNYPFSHFNLVVLIYKTQITKKKFEKHRWINLKRVNSFEVPTLMKKIINKAINFDANK